MLHQTDIADHETYRPCFHDEYLPTFNRPNVELVDTDGKGIDAITPKGVVVDGKEYELDCLIYATGFELATDWSQRSGMEVYGRDGLSLSEKWAEGVSSLHGLTSRAFPNCFIIGVAQAALSPNFLHMTAEQAKHISYIIGECDARGAVSVEPTQAAEEAWVKTIVDNGARRRMFQAQCTPGYYNNEGRETAKASRNAGHGAGALEFIRLLKEWREKGDLEGLELGKSAS